MLEALNVLLVVPHLQKLLELEYLEDFEHFQQRVRG
jgi:hypothetical protein